MGGSTRINSEEALVSHQMGLEEADNIKAGVRAEDRRMEEDGAASEEDEGENRVEFLLGRRLGRRLHLEHQAWWDES